MKKLILVTVGLSGLLAAAAAFLLATETGLRWTLGQVLARTGVAVEVERIEGRLVGPMSLGGVSWDDPGTGAAARLESLQLDWRPAELFQGMLHVTRLHAAGLEYTSGTGAGAGKPGGNGPPELDMALPFEVRVDDFEVATISVRTGDGPPLRLDRVALRGAADAQAVTLEELEVSAPRYGVSGGRLRLGLDGDLPIEINLAWRAAPEDLPAFRGEASADGALAGNDGGNLAPAVTLSEPFAANVQGSVTRLFNQPRWTMKARVPDPVSLDRIKPDWPAVSVQGSAESEGDTRQARVRPDLTLAYQGNETTLTGDAVLTPDGVQVEQARVRRPASGDTIQVAGRVGWKEALTYSVSGKWESLHGPEGAPWSSRQGEFEARGDLEKVTATLSGVVTPPGVAEESPIDVDLTARNLDGAPAATGTINVPYFHYGDITARELKADIDFDAGAGRSSRVSIDARTLQLDDRSVTGLSLQARGTPEDHALTLAAQYEAWSLDLDLSGAYSESSWQGRVTQLAAVSSGEPPVTWKLKSPAAIAWSPGRTELDTLCLARETAELCAGGRFEPGSGWSAQAEIAALPLRWLSTDTPPELNIEGTIAGSAQIENTGAGITGEAGARIASATLDWQSDNPVTTRYENLEFKASLKPDLLEASLDGTVEEDGSIDGELTLSDPLAANGAVRGRLSARLPSLRVLQAFVPSLGLREGAAMVAVNVGGTRDAPSFEGEARVEQAVVDVEALGIRLTGMNLKVEGQPGGRLRFDGGAKSGQGTLDVSGDLGQDSGGAWQGGITLSGENAELVSTPKALIEGNPDLRVDIKPGGGSVTGRIDITRASLTPDAGQSSGVSLSDDIVIASEEAESGPAANPMAWHAKVTIDLGERTKFKGYGLEAGLTGAIELDAPPGQPSKANGTIQLENGQYSLYGRTFDIERGRIFYTGGPVDNPGIELKVAREVGDTTVSLNVSGPLVEPQLSLTSTKPMSETDKMSMLLLGRPASQASGADATLLLRAASSLVPGGVRDLPGNLRSTLGLDTFEVQSGTGETEGASVELGKYIAPDLYVSYVAGFQQTVNVFRVRYELARHWLLRAESSTRESGGDLLFTW